MFLLSLKVDRALQIKTEAEQKSAAGITSRIKETVIAIKCRNNNVLEVC